MDRVAALDAGHITRIGIGVIIAVLVVGFLLSMIITAIIGRIVIVVVVLVLAGWVWQQRTSVENKIDQQRCTLTFFGMHLDPPARLRKC